MRLLSTLQHIIDKASKKTTYILPTEKQLEKELMDIKRNVKSFCEQMDIILFEATRTLDFDFSKKYELMKDDLKTLVETSEQIEKWFKELQKKELSEI